LRRLHHVVERADTPQVRGLVAAVPHLVEIVPAAPAPAKWAAIPNYTIHPKPAALEEPAVSAAPSTEETVVGVSLPVVAEEAAAPAESAKAKAAPAPKAKAAKAQSKPKAEAKAKAKAPKAVKEPEKKKAKAAGKPAKSSKGKK